MPVTDTTHPAHQEQDRDALQRVKELLAFGTDQQPPPEELDTRKVWWHDRYEQLKARGCDLRPRYAPNWAILKNGKKLRPNAEIASG